MSDLLRVLDEIQARAEAATEGPWSAADEHGLIEGATPAWCVSRMRPGFEAMTETEGYMYDVAETMGTNEAADAEFIASARQDVPRLVVMGRAVERLTRDYDGNEYEHTHPVGPAEGEPTCPACWAEDIRRAVSSALAGGETQ